MASWSLSKRKHKCPGFIHRSRCVICLWGFCKEAHVYILMTQHLQPALNRFGTTHSILTFPWCIYFLKAPFSSPLSGALRCKSPALQTSIKETQTQIKLKEPMIEMIWDCFHRPGTRFTLSTIVHILTDARHIEMFLTYCTVQSKALKWVFMMVELTESGIN